MYVFIVFNEIHELIRKMRNNAFHSVHDGFGIMNTTGQEPDKELIDSPKGVSYNPSQFVEK